MRSTGRGGILQTNRERIVGSGSFGHLPGGERCAIATTAFHPVKVDSLMWIFSQLFKITKLFCKLDALSLSSITHILFTTEHRGKNTIIRTFSLIFNLMAAAHKSCDSYVASPFLLPCVNIWELGRSGLLSNDRYHILVWQFFYFSRW